VSPPLSGPGLLRHPEIECKKPQSQHHVYQEFGFLFSNVGCKLPKCPYQPADLSKNQVPRDTTVIVGEPLLHAVLMAWAVRTNGKEPRTRMCEQ